MAVLHKEFIGFDKKVKLSKAKKDSLITSRKDLRTKIRKWFNEEKPNELQPKFNGQGSFEMGTTVNPIVEYDEDGKPLYKYDLDYGIYFIEDDEDSDNKRAINTWHDWVYTSVDDHTNQPTIRKNTCVRVVFADGHHIDLPIYYKKKNDIEIAHKAKGWTESDPKEFYEWFNGKKTNQLERLVRYWKAWKNNKESNNTSLKLPSGFELTILMTNSYVEKDNDDDAFRESIRGIHTKLNEPNGFKCLRPTTPKDEDVFENYSETRKNNFLNASSSLLKDLDKAKDEPNYKKSSEILINNQFGSRFPQGEDKTEEAKNEQLKKSLGAAIVTPKPYGY